MLSSHSSSVVPFSSCLQSLPVSESFPMSQLFTWGGQRTGVSALASFLPRKSQGWSPSEWTGWISLQSKGLSSLLQHHSSKASVLRRSAFFTVQLSHPYMTTGKTIALTRWTFVAKVISASSRGLKTITNQGAMNTTNDQILVSKFHFPPKEPVPQKKKKKRKRLNPGWMVLSDWILVLRGT